MSALESLTPNRPRSASNPIYRIKHLKELWPGVVACGKNDRFTNKGSPFLFSRYTCVKILTSNGPRNFSTVRIKIVGRLLETRLAGSARLKLLAVILASALALLPAAAGQDTSPEETDRQPAAQPAPDGPSVSGQLPDKPVAGRNQTQTQSGLTIKEQQNVEHEKETGTSKDRLFWVLPNFLTIESADHVPPLTAAQKFETTARGLLDPSEFVLQAVVAGLGQASNSIPEYGQGFEGYAKRYATAYADNAVENMMSSAVLPSVLHQDPRYYQLGHGGFARRTLHAFSRLFITRSDAGKDEFNYSEVFGAGMAAAISDYAYHPAGDKSPGNVANVWGTQMGLDYMTYMLKEFWPDLRRKFDRKHRAEPSQ